MLYIICMDMDTKYKIDLIYSINRELVEHDMEPISPDDFNILYDLEIDQLIDTKDRIRERLTVPE